MCTFTCLQGAAGAVGGHLSPVEGQPGGAGGRDGGRHGGAVQTVRTLTPGHQGEPGSQSPTIETITNREPTREPISSLRTEEPVRGGGGLLLYSISRCFYPDSLLTSD